MANWKQINLAFQYNVVGHDAYLWYTLHEAHICFITLVHMAQLGQHTPT